MDRADTKVESCEDDVKAHLMVAIRVDDLEKLKAALARSERLSDLYFENLTAVQKRCTELLNITRADTYFRRNPADATSILQLLWALDVDRTKHPGGPDGMRSFAVGLGEVARAIRNGGIDRIRDELLDLAVVAMRCHMGEHTSLAFAREGASS